MGFLWDVYRISIGSLWDFYLRGSYGTRGFLWDLYGISRGILWDSYWILLDFVGIRIMFIKDFYGIAIGFLLDFYLDLNGVLKRRIYWDLYWIFWGA